jgi:ribonuclease HIII
VTASGAVIGVDESGKGDFFGPLVVAAFAADDSRRPQLEKLGVRDCKLIAEKKLLSIDKDLRRDYPHVLVVIGPKKYNHLHAKMKNLNRLLAWGHARAIENLLQKHPARLAVSDKFGRSDLIEQALFKEGRSIEVRQIVRGEAIIQVAAASILARAAFLRQLEALSQKHSVTLPRGAGAPVDEAGRRVVEKHGPRLLESVAKIHFKNYQRIVGR